MKTIRIVLAGMQPMLHEIVRDSVMRQPDMEIVGEYGETRQLLEAVDGADVAIIGARQPDESGLVLRVLEASPATKVLMIAMNGGHAEIWKLRPSRVRLDDVSPESLISAIRAGAAPVQP